MFLMTLMLATWELPITLFPLNPDLPLGYKKALLQQTGTKVLLSEDELSDDFQQRIIRSEFILLAQLGEVENSSGVNEHQIKLIIATSGSTDIPKAVCLSRGNIMAHVEASNQRVALSDSDNWLNCLPLFHVGGAMIVYRCLLTKCHMQLWDKFQAEQIWQTIGNNSISHISLVPAMLHKLLRITDHMPLPKTFKAVLIGGSALTKNLYEQAKKNGWPICVSYGSSESCSHIATTCHIEGDYISGLTGRPLKNVEIAIEKPSSNSSVGLIKMRGPMIMSGYAQPDYSLGYGLQKGWLVSQDLGYFDEKGQLQVLGRIDEVINSGGEVIHPQVIEHEAAQCPGITDVAIYGVSDVVWGKKMVMVFCGDWGVADVHEWCSEKLRHMFKLREIVKVERIPRNAMGKIQRSELPNLIGVSQSS